MHSHCLKLFCREMLKYGIFCRKKKGFRTVSQKMANLRCEPTDYTFYPALADRIMAPLVAEKSRHTLVVLLEPFHIGIHETHIV